MKTRILRKQVITRRDFLARATTFMAAAGISPLFRPYIRDFLSQNAIAQEGVITTHALVSSESGGEPTTLKSAIRAQVTGEAKHPQLAFYSENNAMPFVTTHAGNQLLLPSNYNLLSGNHLPFISTHIGYGGGINGHDSPHKGSMMSLNGEFATPDVLAAMMHENHLATPLPTVQFKSNNLTCSNLAQISPLFSPLDIAMPSNAVTLTNLQSALSPVASSLIEMGSQEVDLIKAALTWVAELFGNTAVNTKGIKKSVAAIEKSTQDLFNIDIPIVLTQEMIAAYGLDQVNEGGVFPFLIDDPPAGFDSINFRRFFAFSEICMVNNIAPNCSYGYTTQDFHRPIDVFNANEPIFKIQRHFAEALNIFLNRMSNVADPLSPTSSWSIADNLTVLSTTIQGRANLNDNSWPDIGNLWAFVYNRRPNNLPRFKAGTWGDVTAQGQPRGVEVNGTLLPPNMAGKPKDFLQTLWEVMGIEGQHAEGAKKLTGIIT